MTESTENVSPNEEPITPQEAPTPEEQPVPKEEPALEEEPTPKKESSPRRRAFRIGLIIAGAFILGFIIFGVIAIQVWEYSNSVAFCANACHDVHPEEISAFEDSYHANILCTECHMGRVGTINNIFLKASHFRHLPEVIFDQYDRPLESETMRPANESCELCHWPPAFHGDTVRKVIRFEPDEENTPKDTYLILKTGAGTREEGLGYGIHWHVTNPVEYIATDEHKQDIRWVGTTLPDGRTVEYNDVTNPLTPEEIQAAEKKTMDCVDCHNRVGHPFLPPEDLVDQAMVEGRLNPELPNAKQLMLDLITANYASQEEALEAVTATRGEYAAAYPEIATEYAEDLDEAEALAEELVKRLVFEEPGVTWEDFPDQNKHKDFPGCFRCHDGKHLTEDGESIRLHCNICHSVPATVGEGDRPPQLPLAYIQEPDSHLETNFIADHRFQADESCEACHGSLDFGTDDSSFCANSSCHGKSWPAVELDAAFPHPIELVGAHAEAWCHDCHNGDPRPEYVCSNCHEPPEPHFGDTCEDCHTPEGFEGAEMGDFEHPLPLEGAHAAADCADCHVEGQEISSDCASCHQPPGETHFGPNCEDCHTPTSFGDASLPAEAHPFPLEGAHAAADCADCHVEGQEISSDCADCHQPPSETHYGPNCEDCHTPTSFGDASLPAEAHPIPLEGAHATASCEGCHAGEETPEFVCSNCHEPPEDHLPGECDTCHTPAGFAESASFLVDLAPEIAHELEGREDCMMCHDPEGQIAPAPENHVDYTSEQCTLCHEGEE